MLRASVLTVAALVSALLAGAIACRGLAAAASLPIQLCFSNGHRTSVSDDCAAVIVDEIRGARLMIDVQAYEFTETRIADALALAASRHVKVRMIVDRRGLTARNERIDELAARGIPVYVDQIRGIAHNKVMVIDRIEVLTGSFNFTHAANDLNAENLVIIHDPNIAERYERNFLVRLADSVVLR